MRCRCEGEAHGNLMSSSALLRIRHRHFTPRNDSLLIALILVFIIPSILFGITRIEPMMVYGQSRGKTGLSQEIGRDPFVLPSGIRLLSKIDTVSVTKGESSTEISPPPLKLNAILISDHIRLATIDRHIVTVGDSIHDEKILEIKNDRVILGKGDKKRTILLSQSPVQLTVEDR